VKQHFRALQTELVVAFLLAKSVFKKWFADIPVWPMTGLMSARSVSAVFFFLGGKMHGLRGSTT
jgi:hypothetical protein